jgi:ribosomal protein L14E/L6E/L27E
MTKNNLTIGQVVFSKSGRDMGLAFIVIKTCGNFAWLTDGRLRPVARPKKKKRMHIQPTRDVALCIRDCVISGKTLSDADIRRVLKQV